ncbi:MAG: hypothetical protein RR908_01425 [Rikenellaceae bacterium]
MVRKIVLSLFLSCLSVIALAQYVVSEIDPISYRWKQIKREDAGKIIYPDFLEERALMVANISDTIRPYITYGLYNRVYDFPISLHPSTILSNGMVTWTPKRMELMTALPTGSFAVPWLTQLTIHESRHVVQLSNLNQGFTKGASYILGEQAPGIMAIVMPRYFYEGDAVAAETEMTMFGRGLQPEFTIAYRAMMNEETKKLNISKMKLGSYIDYIPSPYEFGYQITQFGREYYGDDFWEKIINYVSRRSYTIFSYHFAFKKYTGKSSDSLITRTFTDLKEYWHEASQVENSSILTPNNSKFYTTYSNPMEINPSLVLSLKESKREATKFVIIDPISGNEREFKYVGYVTSRPTKIGNKILWTEYKPSLFWGNKDRSEIRYLNIEDPHKKRPYSSQPKSVKTIKDDVFYLTPLGNKGYAMISFDKENRSYLLITDTLFHVKHNFPIADPYTTFNGLAWDEDTETLAAIVLDKRGMFLASFDIENGEMTEITDPSYITRNNLRAEGGKLYFNSIASGKDEAHIFYIKSGKELRLTTSKYGSISPNPTSDSTILLNTYTKLGYRLARQKLDSSSMAVIEQTKLPKNIINYPFRSWNVPKIDTMDITSADPKTYEITKYHKAGHLFKVHSWIPLFLNADDLVNERNVTIGAGATVMSQNTLNTMVAGAGIGYVNGGHGIGNVNLTYRGLPVVLDFEFVYGGGKQLLYGLHRKDIFERKNFISTMIKASLPFNFSEGNRNRLLSLGIEYEYNNGLYQNPSNYKERDILTGIHKFTSEISFESYAHKATNDLSPRFGYFVALQSVFSPGQKDFGKVGSFYWGVFLPGFLKNNSVTIKVAYQYQNPEELNFQQSILFPHGVDIVGAMEHQWGSRLSYKAPLLYPDVAFLWNNIYIKRFWIDLFGEMAQYNLVHRDDWNSVYTYGFTLHTNFNVLNISNDIDLALSLFKPSDIKSPLFTIGLGVAF